jgi:hypothetical protein
MRKHTRFLFFLMLALGLFARCTQESTDFPEEEEDILEDNAIKPNDFLSEDQYDQLVVEIVYVEGYKPKSNSSYHLISFLQERLHKSGGITLSSTAIESPGKSVYSISDLQDLEEIHRAHATTDKTLTAWIMIVDGDYAENEDDAKTLGVAYGSSSMALFCKTIQEFSGGLGQPSTHVLETTVLKHEFCHVLGLVDNGTPMVENHLDTQHGKHCSNKNCLMYHAAETSQFITNFFAESVPSLKEQCLNDLKNNGGK